MRSGQLAQLAGVSADTLRHYERLGILQCPTRTAGNYREYPPSSLQRVELIQRALTIGFSLSELKSLLAVRDRGGAPCHQAREWLRSKLAELTRGIEELRAFRTELRRLSSEWDRRLRRTKPGQRALLLEHLSNAVRHRRRGNFRKLKSPSEG